MIYLRRISQIIFLVLFICLLLSSSAFLGIIPVNLFFISNPFLALSTILAGRTLPLVFISAGVLILISMFLGSVFCGWVCPLGTTMDIFRRLRAKNQEPKVKSQKPRLAHIKYFILASIIIISLFGVNIAGWFDPITIAFKGFALGLYPATDYLLKAVGIVEHNPLVFYNSLLFFIILVLILLVTLYQSRFWCRNLCPLGALLAIVSKWRILNINLNKQLCSECNLCLSVCKTGVFNSVDPESVRGDADVSAKDLLAVSPYRINFANLSINDKECIQCFSCVKECPQDGISIGFFKGRRISPSFIPERRSLIIASGVAILSAPLLRKTLSLKKNLHIPLLRPPGSARSEIDFLAKCLRCGECIKVCPTNGLQPLLSDAGLYALFSPTLVPRIGHCSYYCNTCGQVCPSGAIKPLELGDKQEYKIGLAYFDTTRCIPYAHKKNCLCCEEYCPLPQKAIEHYEKDGINYPYIIEELCIGCGLCENICPVSGLAAIRVYPCTTLEAAG
ncbi:MAG: 4Fe-4S binding protein [Planctomycetota bacterium]|nr:4Fe-4S binding protein [Planctomycetota bacterium]MDI6788181.1 4Fe-4S binding protein [Planctomycetota bacterium]